VTQPARALPTLLVVSATLAVLIAALHAPVFSRGALITPAGMQYGQWPFKPYARDMVARGALLEENPALSDLMFQVYPWQLYTARSLQGGWIPLWNPYSYCGVPFVANAQSAVFYPLHWPAWILPSMRVFTFAILMKMLLAGLFMTVFLRGLGCGPAACVLGSVSFALCGFMTAWLGYAHTNAAIALPLLMHAARSMAARPSAGAFLLLAFAGAGQYLGGHPETSLHIVGVSAIYFLCRLPASRRPRLAAGLFAGGSLLGFTLASVQMLPFLEYLRGSAALGQRQSLAGMDPPLPADALMTLLLPGWFGSPVSSTGPGTWRGPVPWQALAVYAGAGVLLAAVVALSWWRRSRFFAATALVAGLVVYGPPAARAALRWIPVLGISSNNRLLLVVSFCLATLAALGLDGVATAEPDVRRRMTRIAITLLAALPLVALALGPGLAGGGGPAGARLAAAVVGGTAALMVLAIARPARGRIYLIGVVAVTCVDMFLFAARYNPHADEAALFPPTRLTDFLRQDGAADMVRGGRLMTVGWSMRPEMQMPYWLSSIEGYDAMEFSRYRHLLDLAGVDHIHQTGEVPDASRPLIDLLGTRYLVTPPGAVVSGGAMRMAYDGVDGRVFVNETARPRFSFARRAGGRDDPEKTLARLAAGRVDLDREVMLEPGASGPPSESGEDAVAPLITLQRSTPGSLDLEVGDRAAAGWLVVSDAWDAGWQARVDGEPAGLLRANYVFMAVPLPAGRAAHVALTYRPLSFRVGVWLSLGSLLFAILVGLTGRAWKDAASPSPLPETRT